MNNMNKPTDVLKKAIELIEKKGKDYQNPNSVIVQADYYPRGCETILDIMHAKILRIRSVMDAMKSDENYQPNFESINDSVIDLINYSSFFVSYMNGGIEGQDFENRDWLNNKIV